MESRRLRVLHVIPAFYPAVRYGGPIESVLRLCQELDRHVDVEVATTNADGGGALDVPLGREQLVQGVRVRYFGRWPRLSYALAPTLLHYLFTTIDAFDLVHVTAAFSFPSTAGCWTARRAGLPYVLSPRGSFQPWARDQKRWKKAPYWHFVERGNVQRATSVHATSEDEARALGTLVPSARVVVIPNGVALPEALPSATRRSNMVLFLGRLHPVKGLDLLLSALESMVPGQLGLELVLAGPNDVGEWQRLRHILAAMPRPPKVSYVGSVTGLAKSELLASATLLVLPSHTENFGQVVVEAMAHATPVVVSRNAPWRILEERGAGLWVPNDPQSLRSAMAHILHNPEKARAMGEAGRVLAREFTWPKAAAAMAEVYKEAVGARPRP